MSEEVDGVGDAVVGAEAGAGDAGAAEAVGAEMEGEEVGDVTADGTEDVSVEHPATASDSESESAIVAAVMMRFMRSMSGTCAESSPRDVRGARPTDVQIIVKGG